MKNTKKATEYEYQFDFMELNDLDSDEIRSLLKSNIISWKTRKLIGVSLSCKIIEEVIPVIACVMVGSNIIETLTRIKANNVKTVKHK